MKTEQKVVIWIGASSDDFDSPSELKQGWRVVSVNVAGAGNDQRAYFTYVFVLEREVEE